VSVKQVIVMRTDLNMRKGKMIAQGAHASMKVFLDRGDVGRIYEAHLATLFRHEAEDGDAGDPGLLIHLTDPMTAWVEGLFTKVCVQAGSEEELLALHRQAQEAGLPCSLVEDQGRTEFHGVITPTCIAIGPAEAEDIDKITGHLKLL
jgi:PTH2 family peptidyl-tRNA hydrolase